MRSRSPHRPLARGSSVLLIAAATFVSGVSAVSVAQEENPVYLDPSQPVQVRVDDLLSRMSLTDKIGQMIQPDLSAVTPADVATYRLGSVLSGGGSTPERNTPTAWADMYDTLQQATQLTSFQIPLIYGIDAVHGHNNVVRHDFPAQHWSWREPRSRAGRTDRPRGCRGGVRHRDRLEFRALFVCRPQ